MPDSGAKATIKVFSDIAHIDPGQWDACAGENSPFIRHAFLSILERSGSVGAKTGWRPCHLGLIAGDGTLLGCVPLYLKQHSYGEYVFDWGWAEAYEQAGGKYYPKLQAAVPFTPVGGPRLLLRPDAPSATDVRLADALVGVAERLGVSSLHVTFCTAEEQAVLQRAGYLARIGQQYHWENQGYAHFDDFLATLASRKRKAIRKERAGVDAAGVAIRTLRGHDIEARHWDAFYRFYLNTIDRKWAHAYLTRDFFRLLGEQLAEQVVLVLAETAGGVPVGGALNILGGDTLYGRYWGCEEQFRFLHFEACYYRAIDFAIAHGLRRVEAGAQGEHKVQRGYLPTLTYSAHWIADAGFRRAVERFLVEEQLAVAEAMREITAQSPYRCEGGS
ncbi:GNAT family N-acetyltransferase [Defluviicoccus vanus]|uniref:N-acetyltransferase n=1 Tax=Defluviicoccus vanus TaxID=111831 RepID=A0A7H1MZZ3_9PROT|nr:GNAT family N-acetyltransferase [Defluviicoccus vanus]QNT69029.1 N-acetyltransferase [Defluviicoccus vanus]